MLFTPNMFVLLSIPTTTTTLGCELLCVYLITSKHFYFSVSAGRSQPSALYICIYEVWAQIIIDLYKQNLILFLLRIMNMVTELFTATEFLPIT